MDESREKCVKGMIGKEKSIGRLKRRIRVVGPDLCHSAQRLPPAQPMKGGTKGINEKTGSL